MGDARRRISVSMPRSLCCGYTVCSIQRRSIIALWEIYHSDLLPACLCMCEWMNLAVYACVQTFTWVCVCVCVVLAGVFLCLTDGMTRDTFYVWVKQVFPNSSLLLLKKVCMKSSSCFNVTVLFSPVNLTRCPWYLKSMQQFCYLHLCFRCRNIDILTQIINWLFRKNQNIDPLRDFYPRNPFPRFSTWFWAVLSDKQRSQWWSFCHTAAIAIKVCVIVINFFLGFFPLTVCLTLFVQKHH